MKINIGTSWGNLRNVDTRGMRFDDLNGHLVLALVATAIDRLSAESAFWRKHFNEARKCNGTIRLHGWARTPRRKALSQDRRGSIDTPDGMDVPSDPPKAKPR